MTQVQNASVLEILAGQDVLVKAKTGTGKTLGFLIPSIDVLIAERHRVAKEVRSQERASRTDTFVLPRILILSPTRELAQQIASEVRMTKYVLLTDERPLWNDLQARLLCSFHKMGVVLLVGGTNMNSDVKALNRIPAEGEPLGTSRSKCKDLSSSACCRPQRHHRGHAGQNPRTHEGHAWLRRTVRGGEGVRHGRG